MTAIIALAAAQGAPADEAAAQPAPSAGARGAISAALAKLYPGARIVVGPELHWSHGGAGMGAGDISILGETSRGEAMFAVSGTDGTRAADGWVDFEAWVPARVALRRVHPGEPVSADMFTPRDVNVAVGQAHEERGVILESGRALTGLQARQTILEGQLLLSSAVERIPDVHRGDVVRVELLSNGLSLVTQGVVEEPGFTGESIHVMASKTKRELMGRLAANGVVEVRL
jgi:flagella basal body P-ring formation protein FlgA